MKKTNLLIVVCALILAACSDNGSNRQQPPTIPNLTKCFQAGGTVYQLATSGNGAIGLISDGATNVSAATALGADGTSFSISGATPTNPSASNTINSASITLAFNSDHTNIESITSFSVNNEIFTSVTLLPDCTSFNVAARPCDDNSDCSGTTTHCDSGVCKCTATPTN